MEEVKMIRTKEELEFFLAADRYALGRSAGRPTLNDLVWKYQVLLRKCEYLEGLASRTGSLLLRLLQARKKRLGYLLGFDIPTGVFGPGLRINHYGCIVVNAKAKVGRWCDIHQGVNIGANNSLNRSDSLVPILKSNVWIGPGAKLFGAIEVGAGAVIGANAVVNKDVPPHSTVAGTPAKVIAEHGTEVVDVSASVHRMNGFFKANPRFEKYRGAS